MGLFSKLFGKGNKKVLSNENKDVFYTKQNELMIAASKEARENFKYFWRELHWEYRRIIPGLTFAMVKIPFEQKFAENEDPIVEQMWINNIDFDGETISGELVNEPHQLNNVSKGDLVRRKVNEIGDWMFAMQGKIYGGFTIQTMRSYMSDRERKEHDKAWRLDFGDPSEVLLAFEQDKEPENLIEHPMSRNMTEKYGDFLKENPKELESHDEHGLFYLHREAIAGNKRCIEILFEFGVDKNQKSKSGKTALDYAKQMNWEHIIPILQ